MPHSSGGTSSTSKSGMKSILFSCCLAVASLIRNSFSSAGSITSGLSFASWWAFSKAVSLSSCFFSWDFCFYLNCLASSSVMLALGIVNTSDPVVVDLWILDWSTNISSSNLSCVIFPLTSMRTYSGWRSTLTSEVSINLGSLSSKRTHVLSVDSENWNS